MANTGTKFHFTKKSILAKLKIFDGKGVTWRDETKKGLCLEVKPTGATSFYFRKMVRGKVIKKWLGRFPDLTVDQAKEQVDVYLGEIAQGKDVSGNKLTVRGSLTLTDYFEVWLKRHGKPHRPGTWKQDSNLFKNWIEPDLGARKLLTINLDDISSLHVKIGDEAGHRTANRMLQLVSIMFNTAKQWKMYHDDNPTVGIKRYREIKRERYLTKDEAPAFFGALNHKDTPLYAKDFFMLALFTGQRKSNVLGMRWEDLQLDSTEALWIIPAAVTKTQKPYVIPLPHPAVLILSGRLRAAKGVSPWVFPASRGEGHLVMNHKIWKGIVERAGLNNLKIHDLRHTLASWQAIAGTSLHIIGKSLGHNSTTTTARYAHLNIEPVRASISNAVTLLVKAGKVSEK